MVVYNNYFGLQSGVLASLALHNSKHLELRTNFARWCAVWPGVGDHAREPLHDGIEIVGGNAVDS
jgi:hypothetical protein